MFQGAMFPEIYTGFYIGESYNQENKWIHINGHS